jgi:hypothetical protein
MNRASAFFLVSAIVAVAGPASAQPAGTRSPDDFRVVKEAPPPPQAPVLGPDGQPLPVQPAPAEKPKGPWDVSVFGYLRVGYDYTMKDPQFDFIGRNNGFILDSARVGIDGRNTNLDLLWRISVEGASDVVSSPNTPLGSLSVRLRDAFARWDPEQWIGVQVGQFKAPFQEEELRGSTNLMFATRAVGVVGVLPGRGFQTPGLSLDRQLGVMISPLAPIGGDVHASYYAMVMNGNGPNQMLDDNGKLALAGRSEVGYRQYVKLGGAVYRNQRTVGTLPNLYDEDDFGLTGDLTVDVAGIQAFAAVTRVRTVFPTVGTSAREQLEWHAQIGYRIELPYSFITPAYRYAYFNPWQVGGDDGFDSFKLQYHTFGLRVGHATLPIQAWVNYTLTVEDPARKLTNDRIEVLGQVTF